MESVNGVTKVTKAKTPCFAVGGSITVSTGERLRGYVRCCGCGKPLKVGLYTKTRIIPKHNREEKK